MGRIFKNLVPYWKSVIMILVLLVLQAFCDLSLPQYTSDIIDVGIQNKGVGHVMPEAVTENEYNLAQLFMTDSEKTIWQESYDSDNGIYRCNVKSEKKLSSYDAVSYTHLRAHETDSYLVCRLLLEKKKKQTYAFQI